MNADRSQIEPNDYGGGFLRGSRLYDLSNIQEPRLKNRLLTVYVLILLVGVASWLRLHIKYEISMDLLVLLHSKTFYTVE